jgi:hypothetical protein
VIGGGGYVPVGELRTCAHADKKIDPQTGESQRIGFKEN